MARQFAVPKSLGLFDRICNASHSALRTPQVQSMVEGAVAVNVMWNMRRQHATQAARWARKVANVRFAGRT